MKAIIAPLRKACIFVAWHVAKYWLVAVSLGFFIALWIQAYTAWQALFAGILAAVFLAGYERQARFLDGIHHPDFDGRSHFVEWLGYVFLCLWAFLNVFGGAVSILGPSLVTLCLLALEPVVVFFIWLTHQDMYPKKPHP